VEEKRRRTEGIRKIITSGVAMIGQSFTPMANCDY
jgi:hypothetical protein